MGDKGAATEGDPLTPSISIRPATLADARAVSDVLAASYSLFYRGWYRDDILDRALPAMTRANPALLASGTYYVAETGGRIVSCGGWSREKVGGAATPGLFHIRHFATHPDFVRRGAAGAVIERCLAEAEAAGAHEMEALSSLPAEAFYAGHGFRTQAAVHVPMAGAAFACMLMRRRF
ncbi:MAG: GNAT family N-acetyltransferase [Parvularculaceae bacterium]|nr:GNAT family N-acetyltransferase [Parvularculaceae bacterium]